MLQITPNVKNLNLWSQRQEALKASLKKQPLIVVCRPTPKELESNPNSNPLISRLAQLNDKGIKHVEIAWSPEPQWKSLIQYAQASFPELQLGVASITSPEALSCVAELELSFSMCPFWDEHLQRMAIELNHLLIPGVYSPSEINQACKFGWTVVKLFPAISLGIDFWSHAKIPLTQVPFVIAAGGLTVSDIEPWLNQGYDAVIIGRKLVSKGNLDPTLEDWLRSNHNQNKGNFVST